MAIQCDVGDRDQIDHCVTKVVEEFGHIDILVNTAIAGAPRVPLLETTEELAELMWRTGPLATMHFIQACYPHMRDRDATVINFASGAGVSGNQHDTQHTDRPKKAFDPLRKLLPANLAKTESE